MNQKQTSSGKAKFQYLESIGGKKERKLPKSLFRDLPLFGISQIYCSFFEIFILATISVSSITAITDYYLNPGGVSPWVLPRVDMNRRHPRSLPGDGRSTRRERSSIQALRTKCTAFLIWKQFLKKEKKGKVRVRISFFLTRKRNLKQTGIEQFNWQREAIWTEFSGE